MDNICHLFIGTTNININVRDAEKRGGKMSIIAVLSCTAIIILFVVISVIYVTSSFDLTATITEEDNK